MSPSNHLRDLQRKSPAASRAGKKGGRALGDGRPAALSHQVRLCPGLETLPGERTPHPSPPTPRQAPGRREVSRGNSFQGGKAAAVSPSPCPPPAPAHPAPALRPLSESLLLPHLARWGRASDPDADADQGIYQGQRRGLGEPRADLRPRDPAQRRSADRRAGLPAPAGNFPGPAPEAPPRSRAPTGPAPPPRARPPAGSPCPYSASCSRCRGRDRAKEGYLGL